MSEMDDELRRMIENTPLTPEARMRQTRERDEAAAFAALQSDAIAENKRFDARLANEARQKYRYEHRWQRRILLTGASAIAAAGIGTAGYFVVKTAGSEHASRSLQYGTGSQLTSVGELKKHGACSDELTAESSYLKAVAEHTNNSTYEKTVRTAASRFAAAAVLAGKYSVQCTPENSSADNLTPLFDVATLKHDGTCADELIASHIDPKEANNDFYREKIELGNTVLDLQTELAKTYNIPC